MNDIFISIRLHGSGSRGSTAPTARVQRMGSQKGDGETQSNIECDMAVVEKSGLAFDRAATDLACQILVRSGMWAVDLHAKLQASDACRDAGHQIRRCIIVQREDLRSLPRFIATLICLAPSLRGSLFSYKMQTHQVICVVAFSPSPPSLSFDSACRKRMFLCHPFSSPSSCATFGRAQIGPSPS